MIKFDKSFSIVHSYLCADGYVIKNPENQKNKYYYIGFRNICDDLLDDFERHFFNVFKVRPRRAKDGRSVIQNKELYLKLTKDFSYYSREWQFPKLSKENSKYWLRAFFDCEGWVLVRRGRDRHIGADSVNGNGLKKVKKNLKNLGIKSKLHKRNGKDIYRLLIFGKENLIKFRKEIGFLHPAKKEKLDEAVDSYIDYVWDFSDKKALLKKLLKDKDGKRIRISSIIKSNIIKLSKYLMQKGVESRVYSCENEHSKYYELAIHKKESVEKVLRLKQTSF